MLLTAHTMSSQQRTIMCSMILQALLGDKPNHHHSSDGDRLLRSACIALLLSLLQYLLLQADQPPAASLVKRVDALLKV